MLDVIMNLGMILKYVMINFHIGTVMIFDEI